MTLDCVIPTQFSIIQTAMSLQWSLQCWSEVFFSILPKCLFATIDMYAYVIDILQGSVETHLRCGGICNTHLIAYCLQSVPVKEL